MSTEIAVVRQALSELPDVSRTWFEWGLEHDRQTKTLVVEVLFDTDPNSPRFKPGVLEKIGHIVQQALTNQTTMVVNNLKVVPNGA